MSGNRQPSPSRTRQRSQSPPCTTRCELRLTVFFARHGTRKGPSSYVTNTQTANTQAIASRFQLKTNIPTVNPSLTSANISLVVPALCDKLQTPIRIEQSTTYYPYILDPNGHLLPGPRAPANGVKPVFLSIERNSSSTMELPSNSARRIIRKSFVVLVCLESGGQLNIIFRSSTAKWIRRTLSVSVSLTTKGYVT